MDEAQPARPRPIIGLNLHPVVKWDDAYRFAANASSALDGAFAKTGDEDARELSEELVGILRRIGDKRKQYEDHFTALRGLDPERFEQARDGVIPWPEVERKEGFVPRCTCYDRCPLHTGIPRLGDGKLVKRDPAEGWECESCNKPCPKHPDVLLYTKDTLRADFEAENVSEEDFRRIMYVLEWRYPEPPENEAKAA